MTAEAFIEAQQTPSPCPGAVRFMVVCQNQHVAKDHLALRQDHQHVQQRGLKVSFCEARGRRLEVMTQSCSVLEGKMTMRVLS